MAAQSMRTIKIFYCYAQEDDALREQLARHLSPFRRLRYITGWYNRDIQAGGNWAKENEKHLDVAKIILLLLSADFFASDHHYTVEMEQAISRHKAGTACVIPILLRPVEWKETPIGELSALPANGKPVTQWINQDEAWLNVVQGIREVVRDLVQKQPLSLEENDVLYPEQGPLSGQIIGKKYLLGELLGEGGFSEVYKAQHIQMRRQQAIKVLHERHFRKQEFRDRFLHEARTIASLDHHYIIHLDDFWTEASQAYLVMPFISGGTLQGILDKQQGFLEPDQVIFYVECVCAALDYAHKKGIAHLDLKPLNLLVHEDGRLLLSDFGLAHLMKQGVIIGGSSLRAGTPHYMAPEHINGSPERRSDLFSLGVLLYQMLVGQLPFDGLPQETILLKNMTERPPAPRSLRPDLPQSVENMLKRALAKQSGQRYQTANEFLIALKNALAPRPQAIKLRSTPATPATLVPVQNASALEQTPPTPGLATTPQNNPKSLGDLPNWLVGILSNADKAQAAFAAPPIPDQPTVETGQAQPASVQKVSTEALLSQIAGASRDELLLKQVADSVLASTTSLPKSIRIQVIQSMQDIHRYIDHGLLTPATEECLRVIDMAPQYLDIHQMLCEIYVRQGKVEQAITKYAILIETYIANGRVSDAVSTYRRILQLEPNNLTYRVRLIGLLSAQGDKEELLRERTLAAESYLKLGYMDRALTELEQALQESPTSVPTRLNYALALQKLGRSQQATAEYQRVLQLDPRNLIALVRWHVAIITGTNSARSSALEVISRVRWQLRGEGLKNYEFVVREYSQTAETYPNNADVRFALGQVHQQAGYFDQAIDAYQLAMRASSYEVLARCSTAQCLLTQGKLETAIQQLEQALQRIRRSGSSVDPTVWAARLREEGEESQAPEVEISLLLAKIYGRVGKREQMQAILRQVKQQTPSQDEVSLALAKISARHSDITSALTEYAELVQHYHSKHQSDNALSVLNEMVRLAPQDPRAHAELGDIYINRRMIDEGIAELRMLADIHNRRGQQQQSSEALHRIATTYAEMGNDEEAFNGYRRTIELAPENMDLLLEMVGFCYRIGRTHDATHYQMIYARYYFDTHQVKEAVAALLQLIALDRNNFEAYDMLGQTYQSVCEYQQASRVYKNLAKINPGSSVARERLTVLAGLQERSS